MRFSRTMIALVAALSAAACSAEPARPPATPAAAPEMTWLTLDGARMLVTTTRAARGRSDPGLPILVVLPWSRSTPGEALTEVGYVDIATPARIVALEGFEKDGAGFSWWRSRPAPRDPDRDPELVAMLTERAARLGALIDAIRRHFGSTAPPVVTGISQGGDLSIALGVLHPSTVSAGLPIASRFPVAMLPPAAEAGAALPAIDVFQGTADTIAPMSSLHCAVSALRQRGYPVELHAYPGVRHEVPANLAADVRVCAALRLRGVRARCGQDQASELASTPCR